MCGGAYVSCWVRAESQADALRLMSESISVAGWKVVALEEECGLVEESWYADNPEGQEHFSQAVRDGECYVFHQWPIEPQQGDNVH